MASAQRGIAVIFGFAGGITVSGVGTLIQDSGEFDHEFKVAETSTADNELIGLVAHNGRYNANLMFTPRGATGTSTIASARLSLEPPAKLAKVTLATFDWATANHGRWVYVGGWKIAFKKDGTATYSLKISCSEDATIDLSTVIT